VVLHVRKHDVFERQGEDLLCDVPVRFDVLVLGGEVEVPTLDGLAKLKLAPGTEPGKVFRLRGKGMPAVEGYGMGDLHARVIPEIPTRIRQRDRDVLQQFTQQMDESNYPQSAALRERAEALYERKKKLENLTD
jgi:molecular chaperone DnaJ